MILITGGAGFIGSNLLASLLEAGQGDIAVCDRLREGDKWRNIARHELSDIILPHQLLAFLEQYGNRLEAIFHMGAISSTTESNADAIVQNNFQLSKLLWEWCTRHNVRFFYASSAATYGDGHKGFDDGEAPEFLSALRPLNAYGWSKHAFDRYVARECEQGHATPPQWAGLKFFNVYGPNEYHKASMRSVAKQLHEQVKQHQKVTLFKSHHKDYTDGGQLRDFVYVKDACDIMLWLFAHPKVSGLFNVGSGTARSFNDLAKSVFAAMGMKDMPIEYCDMPEGMRSKYQYFTQASMDKLRKAGYTGTPTSLENGVADYVNNYLNCKDMYR